MAVTEFALSCAWRIWGMIHSKILGSVSKNVGSKTNLFCFKSYLVIVSLWEKGGTEGWQFWRMQALFGAFPVWHRHYAASVQVLFLNETWWWFASVCYELVFLIILLCIWSITSHCTNSYWEIQLSLHCRKQRQFYFLSLWS